MLILQNLRKPYQEIRIAKQSKTHVPWPVKAQGTIAVEEIPRGPDEAAGNQSQSKVRGCPADSEWSGERNPGILLQSMTQWLCFGHQLYNQVQRAGCYWTPALELQNSSLTSETGRHRGHAGEAAVQRVQSQWRTRWSELLMGWDRSSSEL